MAVRTAETDVQTVTGRLQAILHYLDPRDDDPDYLPVYREIDIDLEQDSLIFLAVFPEEK